MSEKLAVYATINGHAMSFLCEPYQSLLYCLRNHLKLTGTKSGCNDGNCGSCSVLLDGKLVNSCLVLGPEAEGKEITTIEGLATWAGLHPIQQSFIDEDALQCGFCTPGIIIAAKALLDKNTDPSDQEIREWMAGNLCRCTGYDRIVKAVRSAAEVLNKPLQRSYQSIAVPSEKDSKGGEVIGTRPARFGAADKVTGAAIFGADVFPAGALTGKILRSPYAHAKIHTIDTTRAEALRGVHAVVTAEDIAGFIAETGSEPDDSQDYRFLVENVLAKDKVLYVGHAVAAVAAESEELASQAVGLIDVEYELLPPLIDVLEAAAPGSTPIHENLVTQTLGEESEKPGNVSHHIQQVLGDPESGFESADEIVERTFTSATVHQGYLEPHAAAASWSHDGEISVWTTTQGAFTIRTRLSSLLKYPQSRIRVFPTEIGGGFGGKIASYLEGPAILLSKKCGRPVTVAMSRADEFQATGPSSGSVIRMKMGANRDGKITAASADMYYEAGAYPGGLVFGGASVVFSCYEIPNCRIDGYDVIVNKPKSDTYRAPGGTPADFACEQTVSELAARLGIDALEFRAKNLAKEGSTKVDGSAHADIGSEEVLDALKNHPHLSVDLGTPSPGRSRGRGFSLGFWGNYGAESSAVINVHTDASVSLIMGSVDLTGTRTTMAMIAADTLGISLDGVRAVMGDTGSVAYSEMSAGSRTTVATGGAVHQAALDVIAQMTERAAKLWGADPTDIDYRDQLFSWRAESLTFNELSSMLPNTGGPLSGVGNLNMQEIGAAIGAHIADVEVDNETGQVTLLKYSVIQDVGRAVHPEQVMGQMQGGAVQGIGWALYEGYQYDDDARMMNPGFLDYKLPTFLDIPDIDTTIIEKPYAKHPLGIRGVGEIPMVPAAAAIGQAVYDAIGVRMDQLPMTPERIARKAGMI